MTKRSAAKADLVAVEQPAARRATRSAAQKAQLEKERQEEEAELEEARLQRAMDLTATPCLQALPLILVSGFLYKHEIRNVTLTCKDWKSIWVEAQDQLPEYCLVEVKDDHDAKGASWPVWAKVRRLENVIPTQEFARTIFQKLCDIKVAAETTERKKQKVRDALPKWGIDFLFTKMHVWDANGHNGGGIYFTLSNFGGASPMTWRGSFPSQKIRGWSVRIDNYLVLWTWEAFHKWKKIYDGKPLWECSESSSLRRGLFYGWDDSSNLYGPF